MMETAAEKAAFIQDTILPSIGREIGSFSLIARTWGEGMTLFERRVNGQKRVAICVGNHMDGLNALDRGEAIGVVGRRFKGRRGKVGWRFTKGFGR